MKFILFLLVLTTAIPLTAAPRHKRTVPIPEDLSQANPAAPLKGSVDTAGAVVRPKAVAPYAPATKGAPPSPEAIKALCEAKHPIETFMQIASATHPQPSARGGVYFLSDLRDSPQVFYSASALSWPEQISFFPSGVPYYRVSPDGLKVILATHVGGDEQYDLHLYEVASKRTLPLVVDRDKRVESVAWSPDSSWFAYTATGRNKADMDLYRYDLKEKKATLLAALEGHNSVSDVSPDGRLIAIESYRSVTDSDVQIWNLQKRELTTPTKHEGSMENITPLFSTDSKGVFFISDGDREMAQIHYATLQPFNRKTLTTELGEIDDFSLDASRTNLVYVVNNQGYARMGGFSVDRSGKRGARFSVPNREEALTESPSFGYGKTRSLFYSVTSARQSPDIWFYADSRETQWTKSTHAGIPSVCFAKDKLITYPSFDNLSIPAFLYTPVDQVGPVPFIVIAHGGPEAQSRPRFSRLIQYFNERGFGVLTPNVRGSTGYGKKYVSLDDYKNRMDSVKDLTEGAKWLIKEHHSAAGLLAVYGGSYGGFMVLRSIEIEPTLFAAACEMVGITDFVTYLENTRPYRRALREAEYGPLSDKEFLKSISPMTYVEEIKTPLLVLHGANDPRVPVTEAEQLVKALKDHDIPVDFKIFAEEGHGNVKLHDLMEQARLIAYFIDKNLKRGPFQSATETK